MSDIQCVTIRPSGDKLEFELPADSIIPLNINGILTYIFCQYRNNRFTQIDKYKAVITRRRQKYASLRHDPKIYRKQQDYKQTSRRKQKIH